MPEQHPKFIRHKFPRDAADEPETCKIVVTLHYTREEYRILAKYAAERLFRNVHDLCASVSAAAVVAILQKHKQK